MNRLSKTSEIKSIFDVGCGCGANIYLYRKAGLIVGGMDYSSAQISIAKKLFGESVNELICDEAINLPTDEKYGAVFANSVFSYFKDENYALTVLDKMLSKCKKSIGLIDVHDIDRKEEFIQYRRQAVENYDEKYKDLNKFFYRREFFVDWAKQNDLDIEFVESNVEGYWNSAFVFDVYFYKR